MSRILAAPVFLIVLALLGLAVLPVVPQAQTASTELRPATVEETGRLLGENGAGLEAPGDPAAPEAPADEGNTMTITIPRLELKDVPVPDGSTQKELDDEGILRLSDSGVPWQEGSNTFIVGHALGFMRTRVPYVFYDLDKMRPGDEIVIKDPSGKAYTFRVYDYMTVRPEDVWVTYPVEDGRTTLSLQSCTPIPTFKNRLIVRAELVG
jgi:sortase A